MEKFLTYVAKDLLNKYSEDLSDIAVVFPNKRAALFLNQELSKAAGKPIWTPNYITISELFRMQSDLIIADPIKTLCELYESYKQITKRTDTLDEFYGWGNMLLADFDDIDKKLSDAQKVFKNVTDIHELDSINYLTEEQRKLLNRFFKNIIENPTELKHKFIYLWSNLYLIYVDFKTRLRKQGIAYEGMLYRDVIEQGNIPNKHKKYIFIGFNVLQEVEIQLFSKLQKDGRALFYWDYDESYLNSQSEAGIYIRKWLNKFPNELSYNVGTLYNSFSSNKKIRYVAAPSENLQARYVNNWLLEGDRYKEGSNTAVIMCNEGILQAVIHSIPSDVGYINVTTGYPLNQTPISAMVMQILRLEVEGYSLKENAFRLRNINRVLRHQYGKYLIPYAEDMLFKYNSNKQYYVPLSDIPLFASYIKSDKSILVLVDTLVKAVKLIAKNGVSTINEALFQESTFRMYTLLTRLYDLILQGVLKADYSIFKRLLYQLIATTSIPFHGEPAKGVQVMGVLETRNIDFKNVLILSCNEGNMPKGINDNSFIPYSIRKAYGLTTIDNKVAIYSYYFHNILQRAEDVTILYNNSTEGTNTKEMSRFMLQLMVETNHTIQHLMVKCDQKVQATSVSPIIKDENIIKKLNAITRLSPTAINTYLRCQVSFYYKYIVGLKELDDMDIDTMDNRHFGTIFHSAAQLLYEKILPAGVINKLDIEKVLKNRHSLRKDRETMTLDDIIDEAFQTELFQQKSNNKKIHLNGLQLINRKAIERYLLQLLKLDSLVAPLKVIAHEFDISKNIDFTVNEKKHTMLIYGRVDRLDEVEISNGVGQLRLIDYKTGYSPVKKMNTVEDLFQQNNIINKKSDYFIQSMLYSLIESKNDIKFNPQQRPVAPALLFIQRSTVENYTPILSIGNKKINDVTEYETEFIKGITETLQSLFNPLQPFTHAENIKACEHCVYKDFCRR